MSQAIGGGIYGFIFTAAEMFLFIFLFNLNVPNIYPFVHVFGFILAIIFTPAVLGIFVYVNYNNPLIFYLVEIIGFCFFMAITPIDVVIIYCLISMVSILVGYYAGEKFSWYKIIC